MLENVKKTNEKAIEDYFKGFFNDNYTIKANWGYPVTRIIVTNKVEQNETSWDISVNLENENYSLSTKAVEFKKENQNDEETKEIASWATIDKRTLEFIVNGVKYVVNEIFKTPEEREKEKKEKETKETKETKESK